MKHLTCSTTFPRAVRRLPCTRPTLKSERGFSLIELMVVLVIAAILATIGSGYYSGYVMSANRTEARAALTRTAASLDKCKVLYGIYNSPNCNVALPFASESNFYNISGALDATTFVLTATPVAGERQAADNQCKTFTLSQTGLTGATGDNAGICW